MIFPGKADMIGTRNLMKLHPQGTGRTSSAGPCVGRERRHVRVKRNQQTILENYHFHLLPWLDCHMDLPVHAVPRLRRDSRHHWRTDQYGYCTMNEGIGKVLRFGAYSQEVVDRLRWMRDILGPTLGKALRSLENGLAIDPLIAKAVAMGDEFHQRNIAASLAFLKEVAPIITAMDMAEQDRYDVIKFLADTDQFFLNIMMATAKAVMDDARNGTDGTVVTAMCRNGYEFGIRIAGMGDEWFTGPVNIPQGLYFTGYDGEDACPDMGDSAITETFGVGGMAMIAAPAVTRFVGAGGYEDALRTSNEVMEIVVDRNPNFPVPTWNFQGICLGIDARLVVEKGITPVINTGIAHKIAGYGQIGAGTVRPPMECFEKAIMAYAKKLGYQG